MNQRISPQRHDHVEMAIPKSATKPVEDELLPGGYRFASTREQMTRAAAVVLERHGDGACTTLAEVSQRARTVLEALFLPAEKKPPQGTQWQANEAQRGKTPPQFERTPEPGEVEARHRREREARVWRAAVRAWGQEQGRHVSATGPLNPKLVADYEAAHGGAS